MKKGEKVISIKIYLDTNVCLDLIEKARANSNSKYVFDTIKDTNNIYGVISQFTEMEIIDSLQQIYNERALVLSGYQVWEIKRQNTGKELEITDRKRCFEEFTKWQNKFSKLLINYSFIEKNWDISKQLLIQTNIQASDALHLTAAIFSGSQLFATSDENLFKAIKNFKQLSRIIVPINCNKSISLKKFLNSLDKKIKEISGEKPEEDSIQEIVKPILELLDIPTELETMEKEIEKIEREYSGKGGR